MNSHRIQQLVLVFLALFSSSVFGLQGVNVVYPDWFKTNFYDLQADVREAREAGKKGVMVFFSEKSCSYCNAMVEKTLKNKKIVQRLKDNYDAIGLNVFNDAEIVDTKGKTHWVKDFAVLGKARFTPTTIFYDEQGEIQLRLVGYQSPEKFYQVLDYLEGKHYQHMKLSEYLQKGKRVASATRKQVATYDKVLNYKNGKSTLVVFATEDCIKCQQLRKMLNNPIMHDHISRLNLAFVNTQDTVSSVTTPGGKKLSVQQWTAELNLLHRPAMVFFDQQGSEALRVDTDILIDQYGKDISVDDPNILDNIRARLAFFLDKGYLTLPQFQRWRAQQKRQQ